MKIAHGVALLFPGQGAQFVGMGRELHRCFPVVRDLLSEASDLSGVDMARLCFHGPRAALRETVNTQPALFTLGIGVYRVLREHGIEPAWVAGHSLGELTAISAVGCMDFADALALVRERAHLMGKAFADRDAAMAAVAGVSKDRVEGWLRELDTELWIANLNAPAQVVVSGTPGAIEKLEPLARSAGATVKRLAVNCAFHTPMLAGAGADFAALVSEIELRNPICPVIGNVCGAPLADSEAIRADLREQMCAPVRWADAMAYLHRQRPALYLDVGPGNVLKGLLLRNARDARCLTCGTPRDILLARKQLEAA